MNPEGKINYMKGNEHHLDPKAHIVHFSQEEVERMIADLVKGGMTKMEAALEVALQEQQAIEKLNPKIK